MCHLQQLYEKYQDQGMVVLGINCGDEKNITKLMVRENGVTFPNIRDASRVMYKVLDGRYHALGAVPANYIIDRQRKVVDAWYGRNHARALDAMRKVGLEVDPNDLPRTEPEDIVYESL
jgi:peroxiredoxin